MGQVTIYLDKETETKLRKAAKSNQVSVSKWVASIIKEQVKTEWPNDIAELAGSWKDSFPSLREIRSRGRKDVKREEL
ncbi:MAG: CopG family transcriptional regulator [Proteobacteria bacterium]|nr:CopG family transcriptional regulator [Pseudomonadota bacterium]